MLKRHGYGPSFGLMNSCRFIAEALRLRGVEAKVVEVTDNNCIDREVYYYRPTHVIIEALWVVPDKFPVLLRLHPNVKWGVRIHSNMPFISGEGMAIHWLNRYRCLMDDFENFYVMANSQRMTTELELAMNIDAAYLPNVYVNSLTDQNVPRETMRSVYVDIGCFGAIRPLKNQLEQAVAAIIFANELGQPLRFHINSTRVEQNSDPILRNLKGLFEGGCNELVTHPWLPHHEFLKVVRRMDYGLQVSFSETFNIVAADFVFSGVPFVGSSEIEWLAQKSMASATDWQSIVECLRQSKNSRLIAKNQKSLQRFSAEALDTWMAFLTQ